MANDQHTELETELTLDQVKDQLIESGKKRASLNYKEIIEKLSPFEQDAEQMDEFYEQLSDLGIDVVNENDEEVTLRPSEDSENNGREGDDEFHFDDDLSLPPGIKINDPVRMYLKEIDVPCYLPMTKCASPSGLKTGMRKRSAVWPRPTFVSWSVLRSVMLDAECCSLI